MRLENGMNTFNAKIAILSVACLAVILACIVFLNSSHLNIPNVDPNAQLTIEGNQELDAESEKRTGDVYPSVDELWLECPSRRRQVGKRPTENRATIETPEVRQLIDATPSFDQIVELTKSMRLGKTFAHQLKGSSDYTLYHEYWKTDDDPFTTLQICYEYDLPIAVAFSQRNQKTKYLHFYHPEEALALRKSKESPETISDQQR